MDETLLAQYLQNIKERGLKYWHCRVLRIQVSLFLRWLDTQNLTASQITNPALRAYFRRRKAQGNKYRTLMQALSCLRRFCRYLSERKIIEENPTDGLSVHWLDVPGGAESYQGPLRRVLKHPYFLWKFRLPMFAPHWEPYVEHLVNQGYAKHTLFHVLEHNFYFHRYLVERQKIRRFSQITPRLLRAYLHEVTKRFRKKHGRPLLPGYGRNIRAAIKNFFVFAFQRNGQYFIKPRPKQENSVIPDSLLDRYDDFCRTHQGLSPSTRKSYRNQLLRLRRFLDRRAIRRLGSVTLADLDVFLIKAAERLSPKSLQGPVTALRAFLRYLYLHGEIDNDIGRNLISPCRFSADLRPKYLPWNKIQQFLDSIERTHCVGKRDYAILTLLARHGLRAREAQKARISDIDWNNHALFLRQRKNNDSEQIPLCPEAQEALRDYLAVRSPCSSLEIFLTEMAPMKPLESGSVCAVAQRRLAKFFGKLPCPQGAYLLRHSFAKALIDRGAKLHEVGSLLGHRSLRSTLIYTRIATEDLREVADNYAQLL